MRERGSPIINADGIMREMLTDLDENNRTQPDASIRFRQSAQRFCPASVKFTFSPYCHLLIFKDLY